MNFSMEFFCLLYKLITYMKNNEFTSTKVEYTTNINNAINAIKGYYKDPAVNIDKILELHKILWINSIDKRDHKNWDLKYWYRDLVKYNFQRMGTLETILEQIFCQLKEIKLVVQWNDAPKYIKNQLQCQLSVLLNQLKWLKIIVRIA